MTLIGLFQKKIPFMQRADYNKFKRINGYAAYQKPLFLGKTLCQFRADVRVDKVIVRVDWQSADLKICGDIGQGIKNRDVGVWGCEFPDASISKQSDFHVREKGLAVNR